jgi:NTE family protein
LNPTNFDISDSIIDLGKKCGLLYYPVFKHLADSLNELYPPTQPFVKDRLPKTQPKTIARYTVTGLDKTTEKFFLGLSGLQAGKQYSQTAGDEAIRLIYGSRYYKSIKYDFIPLDSTTAEFRYNAEENLLTSVKFAINYNDYTRLSLIGNMTVRDLLFKESRAIASVALIENPRVYLDYYKYVGGNRKLGFGLSWYKEIVDFPLYQDFRLFETLRKNSSLLHARVQYNLNRNSSIALNQQYNHSNLKTIESPDIIFNGKNRFWHSYLSYRLHTLDNKYFTTKGWNIKGDIGYVYDQQGEATVTEDSLVYNADSLGFTFENSQGSMCGLNILCPWAQNCLVRTSCICPYVYAKAFSGYCISGWGNCR